MIHKTFEIKADDSGYTGTLHTYIWEHSPEIAPDRLRPLILICPGGGYGMTSDREAEAVALQYMATGYHAAVLRYAVAPAVYPTALLQLAAAVKLIRDHAAGWYIDPDKIIVQGFSAGGHLAASLGVFWNEQMIADALGTTAEQVKPDGLMLSYPVITSGEYAHQGSFNNLLAGLPEELRQKMSLEHQVGPHVPKTFLWHTFSDTTVPVENSLLFVQALRRYNIPTEFHMYPVGAHGLSLANDITMSGDGGGIQPECESWMPLSLKWLQANF